MSRSESHTVSTSVEVPVTPPRINVESNVGFRVIFSTGVLVSAIVALPSGPVAATQTYGFAETPLPASPSHRTTVTKNTPGNCRRMLTIFLQQWRMEQEV